MVRESVESAFFVYQQLRVTSTAVSVEKEELIKLIIRIRIHECF